MARRPVTEHVYQLDIRLIGIEPPIWRRITVSDQITLASLHLLLQVVMGWEHSHLHQFIVDGTLYGEPDSDYDDEMKDERRVKLHTITREKGASFVYEYDFGDGWQHRITVEGIWTRTENALVPRCLDGKRACPPVIWRKICQGSRGTIGKIRHLFQHDLSSGRLDTAIRNQSPRSRSKCVDVSKSKLSAFPPA